MNYRKRKVTLLNVWDVHVRQKGMKQVLNFMRIWKQNSVYTLLLESIYSIYSTYSVNHYYAQQYMTHKFEEGKSLP